MNIIFDLEIKYSDFHERCNITQLEALYEMRSFIVDRIRILEEYIDAEESEAPGKAVVIDLTESKIVPFKYSIELAKKIGECFAPNDLAWMWAKVEAIIHQGLN